MENSVDFDQTAPMGRLFWFSLFDYDMAEGLFPVACAIFNGAYKNSAGLAPRTKCRMNCSKRPWRRLYVTCVRLHVKCIKVVRHVRTDYNTVLDLHEMVYGKISHIAI